MRNRWPTFAGSVLGLIVVLVVGACACTPAPPPVPDPDPEPTPVDLAEIVVATVPEVSRASSATLGAGGGSIEATGGDGTRYRLIVPPGALSDDVEITVTPAAVDGLDEVADEVAAGVEFAPPGLQFELSAFLIVELAPGRTLPEGAIFSSTHRGDEPGIELPPATVSADSTSVQMQIDHFSGATVWSGSFEQLKVLWNAQWAAVPLLDAQVPGFVAAAKAAVAAVGTSQAEASAALYVSEAVKVHQEVLVPLIDAGDDSIDDVLVARKAVVIFAGHLAMIEALGVVTTEFATPIGTAENVEMLKPLALGGVVEAIGRLRATYLPPQCSAEVVVLADWVNLPSFLGFLMDFTVDQGGFAFPTDLCVFAVAGGPAFDPSVLEQEDRYVNVLADVVTSVPAQTPLPADSTTKPLPGGRVGVVTPALIEVSATGGAFREGDATVDTLTESLAEGSFFGSIDRGEDPELRTLSLSVQGRFRLDGPEGVLKLAVAVISGWDTVELQGGTGSSELGLQVSRWDGLPDAPDVPVDERILAVGGTTNVCVVVRDRLGVTVSGIPVTFNTDGPGEIDTTPQTSIESQFVNGVACAEYQHPDGPVPAGLTARIEVEAQQEADIGRTAIVLQPEEADVRLAARVLPDGAFVPVATNGAFPSGPGDAVEVRATLRGSGATPADPLVTIVDGDLVATLDEGNGILTTNGIPAVPLGLTTGIDGTATFRWEPNGDEPAVIRVAHPADGPGVSATVTVGPDPTTIDGDIVVRTDAEVAALEGVTQITGSLTIGRAINQPAGTPASTVTDLSPLDSLTTIGGTLLVFDNPGLADLDGLDSLVIVRTLSIQNNPALTGLDALGSLQSTQGLGIAGLPLLTDLDGLQGISTLPNGLTMQGNAALTDLTALSNVQGTIGLFSVRGNPVLATLDGLQGITAIDGIFRLGAPALTSLDGVSSLTSISGEVELRNDQDSFASMTTFSLPALTSLGSNLDITGAGQRFQDGAFVDAPPGSITTFDLPALTQIGGRFRLDAHRAGANLQIVTSPELRVDGQVELFDNGTGADISVEMAEIERVSITGNDDARISLRVDRVLDRVDVTSNIGTDLQVDIDTIESRITIGGRRTATRDPGNVGVALSGLRIGSVTGQVRIEGNVGFTDAQALEWLSAVQVNSNFPIVSGNRLE